jgi:poly-gamma-glutamate synthesis protein (capsule biosynthesis protein)
VIRAYIEPLLVEGYLPKGVTGRLADYVARGAAGRAPGPFIVEDGAMELDLRSRAEQRNVEVQLAGEPERGTIFQLDHGQWLAGFAGSGRVQRGRDLLWVGSFEPELVDPEHRGGALWNLERSNHRQTGPEFAYEGGLGARLERNARNESDVVLTHLHRILVEPGTQLSITGMARRSGLASLKLQVSWYRDTVGPSADQTVEALPARAEGSWEPFRVDVTVPPNIVAAGVYLRLEAPERGTATADFDNIRVIAWDRSDAPFSPLHDHLRVMGQGTAALSTQTLPGGDAWREVMRPNTASPLRQR